MQATAVIPTGDNILRGLLSEAAMDRNLEYLQRHHAQFGLPEIVEIVQVEPGVTPGGKHADRIIRMKDGKEIIDVPIDAKSSDYCAMLFKKKCRREGWGYIPTIVVHKSERILDYSIHLVQRLAAELREAFKFLRRKLCSHKAHRKDHALRKKGHHRDDHDPAFFRFNSARMQSC